jgi:antitoxin ParD1/3/4
MTLTVELSPQLEALVREKVESGRYASAEDVIREALQLLQAHDEAAAARHEALRRDIAEGIADLEAGRTVDADTVFAALTSDLTREPGLLGSDRNDVR